ncbi:MAG TPA: UDP-N-acetylmuramate dehydrogenase [Bryobacteraceae bacterium]|nr:UDP-N-acetylmuramate dehydrogenase [Bryobacteraceae bacterium]
MNIALALESIPGLRVEREAPLSNYTRFGLGGPAMILADASEEDAFLEAWHRVRQYGVSLEVIGGGSNLVVSDEGFRGVVLRYVSSDLRAEANTVWADAGAILQDLVDFTIECELSGLHTMTGIPGWVGGAVYGNAGAYGRSIDCSIEMVRFFDGDSVREIGNEECRFRYRDSTFKDNKGWVIFQTRLNLPDGSGAELKKRADEIRAIRDAKYPPEMKCAGSIFKNVIFAQLPELVQVQVDPKVIREGKVPSAWFLEQAGAKGIRNGGIHVADYHANLIYNAGGGTANQVREVVDDLKARVRARFGFTIEEEVQYVGF